MANKKAQYVLVANKDCFNFIIAYEEPQWTIKKADQYPTVPPRITNFFLFPLSIHSPLNEQEAYLLLFKGHKKKCYSMWQVALFDHSWHSTRLAITKSIQLLCIQGAKSLVHNFTLQNHINYILSGRGTSRRCDDGPRRRRLERRREVPGEQAREPPGARVHVDPRRP